MIVNQLPESLARLIEEESKPYSFATVLTERCSLRSRLIQIKSQTDLEEVVAALAGIVCMAAGLWLLF